MGRHGKAAGECAIEVTAQARWACKTFIVGMSHTQWVASPTAIGFLLSVVVLASGCNGQLGSMEEADGVPDPSNPSDPDNVNDPNDSVVTPSDPGPKLVDGRIPQRIWRLTDAQFRVEMRVLFGDDVPDLGTLGEGVPSHGFTNGSFGLQIDQVSAADVFAVTGAYAEHVANNAGSVVSCAGETAGSRACARAYLETLTTRAFRRPVTAAEVDSLMELFDLASEISYEKGIETAVHGVLNAPDFLYRTEIGTGAGVRRLTEYEIASLLSFVLTGRSPDAMLLDAAAAGRLSEPSERLAQAERLLASSQSVWRTFGRQWLDMPRLKENGGALAGAMAEESERFVMETILAGDGTFDALFTSTAGWLTPEMADHYGVSSSGANQAVDLGAERSGLLTRAAWLTSHSRATDTSIELRGHFVWSNLLCNVIPPPPAGATAMQGELVGPDATKREIVEARAALSCNGCHQYMDPIGFGFETFDQKGVYREADQDGAIDPEGTVPDFGSFANAAELSNLIAQSEMGRACFAERLSQFLLGAQLGKPDEVEWLNQAYADFMADGRNVEALVLGLVSHSAFVERGVSQ